MQGRQRGEDEIGERGDSSDESEESSPSKEEGDNDVEEATSTDD